ncbi:hypothetical protein CLOM_g4790 [Closterium sp. NIES-68]|nr:hypothetical protein CLOM_g4790 [Closterium sp. NIES-68]
MHEVTVPTASGTDEGSNEDIAADAEVKDPEQQQQEASKKPKYNSQLENHTWDLVYLPNGKKAIQCKWLAKIKTDEKGEPSVYKSKLVAKGFQQKEKEDYKEEQYINTLAEKYSLQEEREVATPLPSEFKLIKAAEGEGVESEDQRQFQSMVGSLLYAAVHTRPDISFAVGQLARVVQNPTEEQYGAAERVVRYLKSYPTRRRNKPTV